MSDINITQISKENRNKFESSNLVLEFNSNKDYNRVVCNTLRRITRLYVPCICFHEDKISITENSSIYNNDYMRLRLAQLIVPDIKFDIKHLDRKYWLNVNFMDNKRAKHPNEKKLQIYINSSNETHEIKNVTTDDIEVYEDNEQFYPFKNEVPQLLIQLKPKQSFNCKMDSIVGIGYIDDKYTATANAYYDIQNDNKIIFTVKSIDQLDEYDILYRSCIIYVNELLQIKDKTKNLGDKEKKRKKIILKNYDETFIHLIVEILNTYDDILGASMIKPDRLQDVMQVKLQSKNDNAIELFHKAIDDCINIFNDIKNQIYKLGNKYISYK